MRLEYFDNMSPSTVSDDMRDDPSSIEFLDMESRGEVEKARWWNKFNKRERMLETKGVCEFHPVEVKL